MTGALADATGRSDQEMRLALTLLALAGLLVAGLRFLKFLSDLGSDMVGHAHR